MALNDRLRRLARRAGPRHRPPERRPSDVPTRRALAELDEEIRRLEGLMPEEEEVRAARAAEERFLASLEGLGLDAKIAAVERSLAELEEEGED